MEGHHLQPFPFPIGFNPAVFHMLSTDNFDSNIPGGPNDAIHTLASLVNITNKVFRKTQVCLTMGFPF